MSPSRRRKRVHSSQIFNTAEIQALEDRRMLVAFGTAWSDARDLSISFPADNVAVGTYENDIHETLDQIADRGQWQELALRAYQTWAVHADLNVGLRNDFNDDFGVPGRTTRDPRFGEFRIGAFPQTGLAASSVPFQAVAGTYSGDLLLNSNENYTFHDWAGGTGPDPAGINAGDLDLYSVLLHEAGNTLGLDDNQLDWSVMFEQYTSPKGTLTPEDIIAIESLYGARTDPFEQFDNGQLQTASLVATPVGFDPTSEVIRVRGSLVSGTDVDHFKFTPLAGQDDVIVRVRAKGISLLQSRLQWVDATGQVIDQAESASVFANDSELSLTGLSGHSEIYLRVLPKDAQDIYAVGDFQLELDYRPESVRQTDWLTSDHDAGPDQLFANYDLIDAELGQNDVIVDADDLDAIAGNPDRFEFESSVSQASDVDVYRITSPATVEGRLVVQVSGVGVDDPELKVHLLDAAGYSVGTGGTIRADGTVAIEVSQPIASHDYFIRISVDPSSSVGVGNYVAVAEFEKPAAQMNHIIDSDVDDTADQFLRWTAPKTKLYRFDLSADSLDAGQAVRMIIYDAHTREIQMDANVYSGMTRNSLAWLQQGEYILRFSAFAFGDATVTGSNFSVSVDGLSDDQDTDPYDNYDNPLYYAYDTDPEGPYYYPYYYPDLTDGTYYPMDQYYYYSP